MMTAPAPSGLQVPTFCSAPGCVESLGDKVIAFAAAHGLFLDPWQQHVLRSSLGVDAAGRYVAFEVGLVVPRQNGKGGILEAVMLYALFVQRVPLTIYSAHEFKTAQETFRRVRALVEDNDDLLRQLKPQGGIKVSTNESGIELESGERLRFMARSGGAGRGFTSGFLILDEAYNLPPAMIAAILPTMSTAVNPQVWFVSSAGLATSEHLRGIRDRGRGGQSESLAYNEWTAGTLEDIDEQDIDAVIAAALRSNPAIGIRITLDFVLREFEAMGWIEFARERLGVWDEPGTVIEVIPGQVWAGLVDTTSQPQEPLSLAVDTDPSRKWSTIAVAGRREDGRKHVEIIEHRDGTGWVVDRLTALCQKWDIVEVTIDAASAAMSLVPQITYAGIDVQVTTARDYASGCGALYDLAVQDDLRHLGQPDLAAALAGAGTRPLGELWAWSARRSVTDITPLVASTLALWAHVKSMDIANNVW